MTTMEHGTENKTTGDGVERAKIRPGLIVNDGENGFGLSLVLRVMPDGQAVMVTSEAPAQWWSRQAVNLEKAGVPDAGSLLDRMADTIAANFGRFEETSPFATGIARAETVKGGENAAYAELVGFLDHVGAALESIARMREAGEDAAERLDAMEQGLDIAFARGLDMIGDAAWNSQDTRVADVLRRVRMPRRTNGGAK